MAPTVEIDRDAFGRVVAIINGKGGTLKTTLATNVAGLLAQLGMRTLLVDLDPQGDAGVDLGYRDTDLDDEGRALFGALVGLTEAKPVTVRENLDVLVGGPALHQASAGLVSVAAKSPAQAKLSLAIALQPIVEDYDIVLLDCPPNDEMLQNAALAASRYALVPTKTDNASTDGLIAVARRLDAVIDVNKDLSLLGVVLTGVGTAAKRKDEIVMRNAERRARDKIAGHFNSDQHVVLSATIRHSEETASQTRDRGVLVHELEGQKKDEPTWWQIRRGAEAGELVAGAAESVSDDLKAIARELVQRITTAEQAADDEPAKQGAHA